MTNPPTSDSRRLHLVIDHPGPGDWPGRLDVAEALEAAGWTGNDDGQLLRKNGAVWSVWNESDDSGLDCPGGAVIEFPGDTPTVVVVAACLAAAAAAVASNAASVPPGAPVRPSQPSSVSESAQSPTGVPTGPLKPSVARSHNYERMEIARAELDKGFTDQEWAVGRIVCPEGFSCASHPLALFQPTKRGRLPVHRHETFGTPCPGSGQKPTTPPLKLREPTTTATAR